MDTQPLEMEKTDRIKHYEPMKCSVIILNWNGAAMLRRYLPSVVAHTPEADVEIVVADNGSTDDSISVLHEFPTVRLITFDQNYGFAEGYNRAINTIDAEYVVLLNSDVEVTSGWLTAMLNYMDAMPAVAAAQPKVLSWLSLEEHRKSGAPVRFEHAGAAGGYMDCLAYPFCRGRILSYVEEDKHQYDNIVPVFWATGACLCVRTAVYKECGGLDADFFAHMEEIDLCWRMQCRGYHLVCIPNSVIYHLGGGALSYESPHKTYLNFRNNLLMVYKNLPTKYLIPVFLTRFALDWLAAIQMLVSGKPQNAKAVGKARVDFWRMLPHFHSKRKENKKHTTIPYPETIAKRSILFDYYIKKKRS